MNLSDMIYPTEGTPRKQNWVPLRVSETKGEMEGRLAGEVGKESPGGSLWVNATIMVFREELI